ncbi:MAG: LysE family transporter [Bacteroidota bacterium]|jgi:threonine/homoserine/homoserine lactone efflux protein
MELIFFLKGLIIGFGMAVPIGPIGVLCIRKTLAEGHSRGLIIGLGAATADSLYGSIAAFGLTFVSEVIATEHFWLRLVGGSILLYLGIRTYRARRKDSIIPFDNKGLLGSYVSACLLALTNPVTIFAFVAVFAAFGLGHKLTIISACTLVLGVFAGSCLWFLTLSYVATLFRKKLDSSGLRWVNRIAGVLMILSGLAAFVSMI